MISFRLKIGVLVIFQLTSLTLTFCGRFIEWKSSQLSEQVRAETVNSSCNFNQFFSKTKKSQFTVEEEAAVLPSSKFALL